MSYQVGANDPRWSFDTVEFERQCAIFLKAQAIVDDAGRATFVAAMSQAQINGAMKFLLNCIAKVV